MAISAGASFLGLVSHMPSGPGVIADELIAEIVQHVNGRAETVLLSSALTAEAIINHHKKVKTSCIQLVDDLTQGNHQDIKTVLPDVKIIQVIHVTDYNSIVHALEMAKTADYLLLDSGNPDAEIKILGGTGKTHNWNLSLAIVQKSPIPVFLAGGLNVENAKTAIEKVGPFGLDLCSGVRKDEKLNTEKLNKFFREVTN